MSYQRGCQNAEFGLNRSNSMRKLKQYRNVDSFVSIRQPFDNNRFDTRTPEFWGKSSTSPQRKAIAAKKITEA